MTEHYSISDIQESYDYVFEYSYCDKCGSFDLETNSKLADVIDKVLTLVLLGSVPIAIIIIIIDFSLWHVSCLLGIVGLCTFILIGITSYTECKKCGNTKMSTRNVLGYAENDRSVLDVPVNQVTKHQIEIIRVD